MGLLKVFDIKPQSALTSLETRMAKPTPAFSWLDVQNHEHASSFTVAKTAGHDVLDDIMNSVKEAVANGETFETWSNRLIPILQEKGWWGRGLSLDPVSGQMVDSQLGSLRRLQIIYDTNLRQSYAAGRWLEIDRNKQDVPYLMYKHNASMHPRAEHEAWDGICLPVDHEWWLTHYPPNAWCCHCGVIPVSQMQFARLEKSGRISTDAPTTIFRDFTNRRTGEVSQVPKGIDPGFGYNSGIALLQAMSQAA